jgi:argininosuccinate lyase
LRFDKRFFEEDIDGSIAHCKMLAKQKIIKESEASLIIKNLQIIKNELKNGKIKIENAEDIHMFVEQILTDKIGQVGKKLHTARSRNDQVALDMQLYL